MAIIEMTRVSIVGPVEDQPGILEAVATAGVVHLRGRGERPEAPAELEQRRDRVIRVCEGLPPVSDGEWPGPDEAALLVERAQQWVERIEQVRERLVQLEDERERLTPWGGLDPAALEGLAARGVRIGVFEGHRSALDDVDLTALAWSHIVPMAKDRVFVQAVMDGDQDLPLSPIPVPLRGRAAVDEELAEARARLRPLEQQRTDAASWHAVLQQYRHWLDDRITLHHARDGLASTQPLFVLDGYCPTDRLEALRDALEPGEVVLMTQPAGETEAVPIALRNGPIVRTFEPLVAAFTLPTYGELDPTPLLAPFMGLFFGLCLSDLGYGALLTAIAGGVLLRARLPDAVRILLRWVLVLGVGAMLVGALLGNVFGLRIHDLLGLSPSALLFSLVEDPRRMLAVSLGLGALQLSLGMALRLWRDVRRRRWQVAVGSLAWLGVIPSFALPMAGIGPWWPFGVVCGVLLLFAAPERSVWRRLGRGAWALYDVSGVLANVMSYARLFGLGLSSGIIAMVVNTIAAVLADGVVGTMAAVLVLVLGHAFNFAMAVVGSVVHPARLQLLEFFNTFFEGGGRAYAPLRRTFSEE